MQAQVLSPTPSKPEKRPPAPKRVQPARRSRFSLAQMEALQAYLFILPGFLGFLAFMVIPIVISFGISLYEWELLVPPRFVGLENYKALLKDRLFLSVLKNTGYYVLGVVPLNIVLALGMALWLNQKLRFLAFYRSAIFLPVVTLTVAVSLIFKWMYEPEIGLINAALGLFGIKGPLWLGSADWAMPALIFMNVWKGFGYNMVLFLAGLQSIPQTVYEAAGIDGANKWQKFRYVTLPLLSPTTFFASVMTIISSFQVFDAARVMTNGGPVNSTNTIVLYIFQNGFEYFKMGYASAIAWVLFATLFVLTVLQMRLQRQWVHYD